MGREVKLERTGWRDGGLSQRHRLWGWDCPMIDIDFLALEYDEGQPIALIEYKQEQAEPQNSNHPSYRALCSLGDAADVPVFGVRYAEDFSQWRVLPLNGCAKGILSYQYHMMSEGEYVAFLYRLRGRDVPGDLFGATLEV